MDERAVKIHALTAMTETWPLLDDGNRPETVEYWTAVGQAVVDAQDPTKVAEWIAARMMQFAAIRAHNESLNEAFGADYTAEADECDVVVSWPNQTSGCCYRTLPINMARTIALALLQLPDGSTRKTVERILRGQNA